MKKETSQKYYHINFQLRGGSSCSSDIYINGDVIKFIEKIFKKKIKIILSSKPGKSPHLFICTKNITSIGLTEIKEKTDEMPV